MKILLVQTSFLGDTILSTPVIAGIKKLHPEAELWMMTTPAAAHLVRRDPLLAGVLVFDKRRSDRGITGLLRKAGELRALQFDRVYALHRSWRTALVLALAGIPLRVGFDEAKLSFLYHRTSKRHGLSHDVLRNLAVLVPEAPLNSFETTLRIFAPSTEDLDPEFVVRMPPRGRYIAVVPGSAWYTKRWHVERYRELIAQLGRVGHQVVVLGDAGEVEVARVACEGSTAVNLCGATSIAELMYVIEGARALVCNDSMALHLGSAFKIPSVAVFCATSPAFGFGPWENPRAEVVELKELHCKPCSRHGGPRCPLGTEDCMRQLPSGEVYAALQRVLGA